MSFSFPDATRVRPRHVGTECVFAFVRPKDLCLSANNDPLSQGALEWLPWPRPSGPDGPEASPECFARARSELPEHFFLPLARVLKRPVVCSGGVKSKSNFGSPDNLSNFGAPGNLASNFGTP